MQLLQLHKRGIEPTTCWNLISNNQYRAYALTAWATLPWIYTKLAYLCTLLSAIKWLSQNFMLPVYLLYWAPPAPSPPFSVGISSRASPSSYKMLMACQSTPSSFRCTKYISFTSPLSPWFIEYSVSVSFPFLDSFLVKASDNRLWCFSYC